MLSQYSISRLTYIVVTFRRWPERDAKLLFHTRADLEDDFQGTMRHATLWKNIASKMSEVGVLYTAEQCTSKWKSMKREYRSVQDHNNRTGNDPKTCLLYNEFCELYGGRAASNPIAVVDTFDVGVPLVPLVPQRNPVRNRRVPAPGTRDALLEEHIASTKRYREEQQEFQRRALEQQERHHVERIAILQQILEVMRNK